METELFRQLASTGVVGILLILTLLALRNERNELKLALKRLEEEMQARIEDSKAKDERIEAKDARLEEEMNERIEDAKRFNEMAMRLQQEVIQSVSNLGRITHEIAGLGELIRDWHREHGPHSSRGPNAPLAPGGQP